MLDDPEGTVPDVASLRSRLEEIESRKRVSEDRCRTCGGSGVVPRPAAAPPADAIVSGGTGPAAVLAGTPGIECAGATVESPS